MKCLENFSKPQKPWEVEGVEWREVRLGEFFEIVRGGSPRPIKQYLTDSPDGINWIKIGDAEEEDKFISKTKEKIIKDGIKKSRVVYPGDLLLTNSMTVGKAYISKIKGCIHDGWLLFHPRGDNLYPDYFYYLLNSHILREKFSKKARGGVVRNLNTSLVKSTKIPLPFRNDKPDLETQKKIVEYIETSFSKIDSILEKKKIILSHLDELWESILENAFKPRAGEEWKEVEFLNMVNLIKGSKPKKVFKEKQDNTLPYLTTEYFREKVIKEFIPIKENKLTFINKGDLVIIADGSRSGELFFCDREGVLVSTMAKLEIKKREIYKKYFFWFLTIHFEQLNKSKYTATPHVNKNHLKKLKLPLPFRNGKPDLERQKEIAEYLDRVYEKIKSIKEKVQSQINQLEDMKESIFNEVFSHDKGK